MTEEPFWKSSQILWALGVVAGGIVGVGTFICENFHVLCLNISEEHVGKLLGALAAIVGGGVWIWKRIQAGNDPNNPASKLTLK